MMEGKPRRNKGRFSKGKKGKGWYGIRASKGCNCVGWVRDVQQGRF